MIGGITLGMTQRYKPVIIHIAAWILYVLVLFLGTEKPGLNFWINTTCTIIPVVILFYLNIAFLFPKFLEKRNYASLITLLVVFNLCTICLRFLLAMYLQQNNWNSFIDNIVSPVSFWNQFRVNLLFIGISFAYWYARKSYRSDKNQQKLESELLQARLSSLKNQINPHFLYNTLSFIYTKSLPHSSELAAAIARLSDMMRYSLGEIGEDGKVLLEKEITHLENFIEIHQMRFDNKLKISFEVEGESAQHRIMPLLLITFVENAFKHGKLNDADHPLTISLNIFDEFMTFDVQNKKSTGKKEIYNGIGLQNIRNRLELAYPGLHELKIDEAGEDFTVNLKLHYSND